MHDLIHDLAQEVAGKESYLMQETSKRSDGKTRHVVPLRLSPLLNQSNTFGNFKGLRTFLLLSWCYGDESQVSTIIAKYRRLRVLDLQMIGIKALPSTIKYLLHLRYLDLSLNRELKMLPESITRLYNLQVLSLRSCLNLEELPKDMRELVNLRHLDLKGCYELTHMPAGMDSMTGLCTLTRFVLGSESSKKAQIGQLRDLMPLINIRGTLAIVSKKGYAYDLTEQGTYLLNKKHIKSLLITNGVWQKEKEVEFNVDERLLERLEPHRDLREIHICGYKGVTLPRWAATLEISLPQLVRIHLSYFSSLRRLPAMSQLQHLKDLSLGDIPNVELMEKNDSKVAHSFPSLENLYLWKCPSLKSFPRCPHVKTFTLLGLNEALAFCQERDDEANATTPAASSISASSSSSNDNSSAGCDVFDLRKLEIDSFQLMKSLFGESIRSIDELRLHDDIEVESLWSVVQEYQRKCTLSIDSLELRKCGNLKSVSGGGIEYLTNLKKLYIDDCPKLELEEEEGFPWKDLHGLSDLSLKTLPQMRDIPKGIQYLTSLQTLSIKSCENMKTHPEWLHCPMSLRSLDISYCPMVKTLPEANLPSLTRLTIWSCDGLKERYSKPNGTHFSQISHIPSLTLYFGVILQTKLSPPHSVATNST